MSPNVVELKVKRPAMIRLEDGREYTLSFPLVAVIALEEKLGRNMRNSLDWLKITPAELPTIIETGLSSEHKDAAEVATAIAGALSAEDTENVIEGLCWAAFPRAMRAYADAIEKARSAAANGEEYKPGNVHSAGVS